MRHQIKQSKAIALEKAEGKPTGFSDSSDDNEMLLTEYDAESRQVGKARPRLGVTTGRISEVEDLDSPLATMGNHQVPLTAKNAVVAANSFLVTPNEHSRQAMHNLNSTGDQEMKNGGNTMFSAKDIKTGTRNSTQRNTVGATTRTKNSTHAHTSAGMASSK